MRNKRWNLFINQSRLFLWKKKSDNL